MIYVDPSILELDHFQQALIHKSTSKLKNNERLEFLGDAVLEIVVSEYLFNRFPDHDEGTMTQIRADLVNTQSLSDLFQMLSCKDQLKLSKGTLNLDETHKHSIYAGTLEALVGAVFIEQGFESARAFALNIFKFKLLSIRKDGIYKDFKSQLQEKLQAAKLELPKYLFHSNKAGTEYTCNVNFQDLIFSSTSQLKKEAEQRVAMQILKHLDNL